MTDTFPEIIQFSNSPPPLASGQVHLMVTSLDELAKHRNRAVAVINPEEQARAARFINTAHGENFRLVRGSLRCYLEDYLGVSASAIRLVFNDHGKPEIEPAQNPQALRFNVSHSHHMAAFAFTLGDNIGIDIEVIKPVKDLTGLAQHVCSPRELEEFTAPDERGLQEAFFRLWTRKEAFIKAMGQGLSMGLRAIYIGFDTDKAEHPVQYRGVWLHQWRVKDVPCEENYKLAVAVGVSA